MNHVHSTYGKCEGLSRKEIIDMLDNALEIIYEYYVSVDTTTTYTNFEAVLGDLDDKVLFIKQYYRYGWCLYIPTKVKEYMNTICDTMLQSSRIIVGDYISEMKDPGYYDSDSSDESCDDEPSCDDESCDDEPSCDDESCKDEPSCDDESCKDEPSCDDESCKDEPSNGNITNSSDESNMIDGSDSCSSSDDDMSDLDENKHKED